MPSSNFRECTLHFRSGNFREILALIYNPCHRLIEYIDNPVGKLTKMTKRGRLMVKLFLDTGWLSSACTFLPFAVFLGLFYIFILTSLVVYINTYNFHYFIQCSHPVFEFIIHGVSFRLR